MNYRDPALIAANNLFFVRHNISFYTDETYKKVDKHRTEKALRNAWKNDYVLIDYEEKNSVAEAYDPLSYSGKSAKSCIRRFNQFLDSGGYIVIASNSTNPGELKAGWVPPKSARKLISAEIDETYNFKGIQLAQGSVETFDMAQAPGLFSAIVRQLTFCEWDSGKRQFEFSYLKIKPSKLSIEDFHHKQLEVLCMEYLRAHLPDKELRLAKQTMPLGGSLANVDIVGLDASGNEILAQVTFHTDIEEKEKKLVSAIGRNGNSTKPQGFYFGAVQSKRKDDIHFVNIEEVLQTFIRHDENYLYKMLGF